MWSDGGPIDPSPTIDQAINGGYGLLEIECSRCRTKRDVDLASFAAGRDHVRARSRIAPDLFEVQSRREAPATLLQPRRWRGKLRFFGFASNVS